MGAYAVHGKLIIKTCPVCVPTFEIMASTTPRHLRMRILLKSPAYTLQYFCTKEFKELGL